MSAGSIYNLPYIVDAPQSSDSCLTCSPIEEALKFKANTQLIRCQINSKCEGVGGGGQGGLSVKPQRKMQKSLTYMFNRMAFWA